MMAEALRIIPLGGLGEIGKNMMLFEYADQHPGRRRGHHVSGVRHVGHRPGAARLQLSPRPRRQRSRASSSRTGTRTTSAGCPTCSATCCRPTRRSMRTPLALGLIRAKLSEYPLLEDLDLRPVSAGSTITVGPFEVEFLAITHSIPDGVGPGDQDPGRDWSSTPATSSSTTRRCAVPGPDLRGSGQLGAQGVLALLSDSTGSERAGHTPSEAVIAPGVRPDLPGGAGPDHHRHVCLAAQPRAAGDRRCAAPRPGGRAGRLLDGQDGRDREGARSSGGAGGRAGRPGRGAEAAGREGHDRDDRVAGPARGRARAHGRGHAPPDRGEAGRHDHPVVDPDPRQRGGGVAADQQADRPRRRPDLPAPRDGPRLRTRKPGRAEADAFADPAEVLYPGARRAAAHACARPARAGSSAFPQKTSSWWKTARCSS